MHETPRTYWTAPNWRPPIDPKSLRPGRGWYAASALPLVLGLAGLAAFIVLAVQAFPEQPRSFTAPGRVVLELKRDDDQTIYRETSAGAGGAGRPECSVRERNSERRAELRPAGDITVTFGSNEYRAQLHFTPPLDGTYTVSCHARNPEPLAVGDRPRLGRFGAYIGLAIASVALGVVACGGAVALVAIMRNRHKRRLQDEAMRGQPGV